MSNKKTTEDVMCHGRKVLINRSISALLGLADLMESGGQERTANMVRLLVLEIEENLGATIQRGVVFFY